MDIKILQIAADTKNNKEIKNFTHKSKNKNPLCGDEIEISLIVKNKKILDLGYQCKSCIYCEASASLLSKLVIKKSLDKINELSIFVSDFFKENNSKFSKEWKPFEKLFDKKNISRKECILLPFKTLAKALKS
jgi:nitrogen fixation NifU-like protein|tara:strand:- start:974 stop:1372 length:399 start_codon:yes stop_codon:yes gene_type:complete